MTATATQRLTQLDHDVEALKSGFVEVISQLQQFSEADTSFDERWSRIAMRMKQLRNDLRPEDFDKSQVLTISKAMLDIQDLRDDLQGSNRLDALNELLVNVERLRHVIRDALDEHVEDVDGSRGATTRELLERLPGASRADVAILLGIDRRTLLRWLESDKTPPARLRIVARVVAVLRHNWTGEGRLAWFHRPRRDLGGRTPLQVLDATPMEGEALMSAARAGRSQYAS